METEKVKPTVGKLLRELTDDQETILDVIADVDGSTTISFGKRQLLPEEPEVARALAREHEFHSIGAFCEYLGRESNGEKSVALADVDGARITAVLDELNEGDRESISFFAKTHPLFAPWKALIGKAPTVTEFALFVMQNRSAVLVPDGRELALMFSQVKAAKSITKKVGVGPRALNGVMIEMQIGSERNEIMVELPERITISAPLYLDTDPIDIQLDLLVTEANGNIVVFVTAPELEQLAFSVFQRMVETVSKETGMCVGLGKVTHREWRLVK